MFVFLKVLRFALVTVLLSLPVQADELLLTKNKMVQIQPLVWAAEGLKMPEPDAALPIVGPRNTLDGVKLLRIYNGQGDIRVL